MKTATYTVDAKVPEHSQMIDERPPQADDRTQAGHWESQWRCQPAIGTAGTGSM